MVTSVLAEFACIRKNFCQLSCLVLHLKLMIVYSWLLLQPPYVIGQAIVFLPCGLFLFHSSSFFSSPNLSRHRLHFYHTSTHGVALVRI